VKPWRISATELSFTILLESGMLVSPTFYCA
jgi:hypothetical protein